jgi:hypothetical protein
MGILNIFSKRQKQSRGEAPDVYTYDSIPRPLKVQIIHIWRETLGDANDYDAYHNQPRNAYKMIVEALRKEYGVFSLVGKDQQMDDYLPELANFLLQEQDSEKALDAIELSFRLITRATRSWEYLNRSDASERADSAIAELNARFREHAIGYEFDGEEIIRVDSELLHAEAVKPALALLRSPEYAGAQAEFLTAHEHYRHGRTKEALAECLKALESVMKAICAKRKWRHDPNATAKALLDVIFDNGLVPAFWNQHFSALRATLEAGVPTARNRLGGHGQGTQVVQVPAHLAAYVLHLAASAIVFLAEAERSLP